MKKMYGILTAAMVLSSIGTQNVNASLAQIERIKLSDNGYVSDENGIYVISSNEIIRLVSEKSSYMMTGNFYKVLEFDSEPSEEEMSAIGINSHGCTYVMVSSENPYILHPNGDGTIEKAENILPYVSYELDGIAHELKDARTNTVITKFNELTDSVDSNVIHPAEGQLWSAYVYYDDALKADICQYSPMIYSGSTENKVMIANLESTTSGTEIFTGDLNFDGTVDITDLSMLSLNLIGDTNLNSVQNYTADVTGDGQTDLRDLARLRQYLSKVVTSLR